MVYVILKTIRNQCNVTPLYKYGIQQALRDLGLDTEKYEKGTPYPTKSPMIGAERLADLLQKEEDQPERIAPENKQPSVLGRPVSWSSPVSLRGQIGTGANTTGLIVPYTSRG